MTLSKSQRAILFAMFGGKCAYCGHELPERGWHADHVEPVYREWWKALRPETSTHWDEAQNKFISLPNDRRITMERPQNDRWENMFPACRACNIDKGAMRLEDWRKSLEQRPRVCRDNHSAFRHAERFGLVAVVKAKVVFYFESFNKTVPNAHIDIAE